MRSLGAGEASVKVIVGNHISGDHLSSLVVLDRELESESRFVGLSEDGGNSFGVGVEDSVQGNSCSLHRLLVHCFY